MSIPSEWHEFCSALDVIGDTELALGAYVAELPASTAGEHHATGTDYLKVYGVLQCLVVQQDAVRAIGKIVPQAHADTETTQRLRQIRDIRNLSVGHPTRAARQAGQPSSFIVRLTMATGAFHLMVLYADGHHDMRHIRVMELIATQRKDLARAIVGARERLLGDDYKHRKKYRRMKLTDILSNVGYDLGKVYDLIHTKEGPRHMRELGQLNLPTVVETLDKVETELRSRGDFDGVKDTLGPDLALARHCASRIREYFERGDIDDRLLMDADAFYRALSGLIDSLRSALEDIDHEYQVGT